MFANAKTIKPAANKKKAEKVQMAVEGLEVMAAIDHVVKSMAALKKTVETEVKEQLARYFVTNGCARKVRPANFEGFEGAATASCELRNRSSNSPLSDDEVILLQQNKVSIKVVETAAETFVLNPAYANDAKLLGRIEAALKTVRGIPEDLFMKQVGVSKTVVGDTALDEVFSNAPKVAAALLPIVGALAVKPSLNGAGEMSSIEAFKIVQDFITGTEDDAV